MVVQATIKDLKREAWLRMREQRRIVWKTKDGNEIPIQDLSTKHLVNILIMEQKAELERQNYYDALESFPEEY